MARKLQPRKWLFFALDTVPQGEDGPLLFRWSTRPIVYQAFPAFIEGRIPVEGWREIVRSSSGMSGEYSLDHAAAVLNDADGLIRGLLDDPVTQWFEHRQGHLLLLSDAAIRAGLLPPRVLFCGLCSDVQLLDKRQASIEFEDVLARTIDKTYPQYTLGDAYPYLFANDPVEDVDTIDATDPNLQIPKVLRDQVIPIYYGPHVESRVDPLTDTPVQARLCPTFFMGFLAGNFGDSPPDAGEFPPELADLMSPFGPEETWGNWGELVVGLGEYAIPSIAVSNLAGGGSPPAGPAPVILTDDRYGVDAMVPGHAAWPFATDYVIRNGYRLTVIYARGPVLWDHITGRCPITVDVCGWPDAARVPIDQAGFAWQDFLTQHVFAHDGAGYTSGPAVTTLPMFAPTVDIDRSKIWTSKVQAFQATTAERLGTEKGYLMSMSLLEPTPLREILRIWNVTFDAFTAKNSAGQIYPWTINDVGSVDDGVPIRERIELLGLPAPTIDRPAIENAIDYTVGWDPKTQAPRTITIPIRHQPSIDAMAGDVRKASGIRNLQYTSDDATAADVMGRRLLRLREAPRIQAIPVRMDGIDREIGEQVRVTHRDGFGSAGYVLRPMVILNHRIDGDAVTLEALDIRRILVEGAAWTEDAAPTWGDATPAERESLGFWTEDDGTIPPDGARGSEFR